MTRQARFVPRWFLVAVALVLPVPALTVLLNLPPVQRAVLKSLKAGAGLEMSALRLRLVPRLTVEFSDLVLRTEQWPAGAFRARRGSVKLRLLPLLKKRLAVVEVIADEPHLFIRRDAEGHWHGPFDRPEGAPSEGEESRFTWTGLLPDLQLTSGTVVWIDEYERATPREVHVTGVNAVIDSDLLRTEADVSLTGTLDGGRLFLSGSLSLLGAAPSVRFEGSLELERFDAAPWLDEARASASEDSWRVDLTTQLLVMPGHRGHDLTLSRLHVRLPWWTVRGQGVIHGLGEAPLYSATVSATPVSISTLIQHLPSTWIPSAAGALVADHELEGAVELLSATVNGRLDRPQPVTWKGTVNLSHGAARVGVGRTPIGNLAATLFIDPLHIEAIDLSGEVGAIRLSHGRVRLDHVSVAPTLDVQLTANGTARDLLALLHGFGGATAGERALSAITDPRGEVHVSLHVAGPLTPEAHVDLVDAEITGHDLGARIPAWNLAAEHLDGTVGITPRFIELKHLRGTLGPVRFDAQGAMETGPAARFEDVTVELSASAADLQRWLVGERAGRSSVTLEGTVQTTVHLSGPAASPRWRGRVDLTQIGVRAPPVIRKLSGTAAALEGEGTWIAGRRLTAQHVALVIPEARADGRVTIRLHGRPSIDLHVQAGPLPIENLSNIVVLWPGLEGVVRLSLTAKGWGADWRTWSRSGSIEVQRGALTVPAFRDRFRDIACRLQVAGQDAMLNSLTFKAGDSDVAVSGVIKHWADRPSPTLMVTSSRLDLTRLIPQQPMGAESDSDLPAGLRRWTIANRADITLAIQQAQYHRLVFKTLSGHVTVGHGRINLDRLLGETPEGRLAVRVTADLRPRDRIELDGDVDVDGMPVHQVMSVFDPDADRLRGLLSLAGHLRATLRPAVPLIGTLHSRGPLRVRLTKGHIVHGTVLPKVLTLLNVPALLKGRVDLDHDGIPFDSLGATVSVDAGLLTSNDLVFDSPLLKISGAGHYNLAADKLDVALAVSPLGAYTDILGTVPLFGRLLAGDRPGLSTALFQVTGPWQDPVVQYLPLESLAKGLTGYPRLAIDVLRNVFTLPGELLAPSGP